ncbi:hypothetical protein PLANPX_1477 [Lacipirellula parvula]|uniref:Uncharacterized protein n=1 Tax=Lacipirellula parvula TaxID=2650471 RepID=A0A5K7X681_9BACT|nr:hypothetical protein PLANPX_1477 [Lacipirellula parvula]
MLRAQPELGQQTSTRTEPLKPKPQSPQLAINCRLSPRQSHEKPHLID